MEAILYTAAFVFFAVCFIHWRIVERRDRLARESKARATLWSDTQEWYRIESQHGPKEVYCNHDKRNKSPRKRTH